jgi:hypothetical protein
MPGRALAAVNTALIDLYWALGEYIIHRIEAERWGKGTVKALAERIAKRRPNVRGFSAQNLWRTRQFYETYRGQPKLSPLLGPISDPAALLIVWTAALGVLVASTSMRPFISLSCSQRGDEMTPIAKSEPVFHLLESATKKRLLPWSLPNRLRKTVFFFVLFQR